MPPEGQARDGGVAAPVSVERLRLRGEITRLEARQRGLAPVRAENERLRRELAAATNNAAGPALPPGYLRQADARMAGCGTPEDTLETLLWALHQKNEDRLAELFDPVALWQFKSVQAGDYLIGLAIVGKEQTPGSQVVELRVLVAPDVPPTRFFLKPVGGEWRIAAFSRGLVARPRPQVSARWPAGIRRCLMSWQFQAARLRYYYERPNRTRPARLWRAAGYQRHTDPSGHAP